MKEGILNNLNKIQENKNILDFTKTSKKTIHSKSIPRVFSKDQMDVWISSDKIPEVSLTLSQHFDKQSELKTEH